MSRPKCLRCGAGAEWIEGKVPNEPKMEAHSLQRPCSVSGTVASDCRSIEPWILNAARELAMDSAHVPLIARIIERHAPTLNAEVSEVAVADSTKTSGVRPPLSLD